jgi:hypothetical protein
MTSCRDRGSNSDELDRMDTKAALAAFGRQTTLNVAAYCPPTSTVSAGQQ